MSFSTKRLQLSIFVCLLGLALVILPEWGQAQCSMCRAVTNSNQLTDDAFTVGNGLNNAILYLMAMPYILAIVFFYAFYRKQIMAWFKKS